MSRRPSTSLHGVGRHAGGRRFNGFVSLSPVVIGFALLVAPEFKCLDRVVSKRPSQPSRPSSTAELQRLAGDGAGDGPVDGSAAAGQPSLDSTGGRDDDGDGEFGGVRR
jgi:hypothetical protein